MTIIYIYYSLFVPGLLPIVLIAYYASYYILTRIYKLVILFSDALVSLSLFRGHLYVYGGHYDLVVSALACCRLRFILYYLTVFCS